MPRSLDQIAQSRARLQQQKEALAAQQRKDAADERHLKRAHRLRRLRTVSLLVERAGLLDVPDALLTHSLAVVAATIAAHAPGTVEASAGGLASGSPQTAHTPANLGGGEGGVFSLAGDPKKKGCALTQTSGMFAEEPGDMEQGSSWPRMAEKGEKGEKDEGG